MIMITAILYGVLVHVIVCTTADGSEKHQINNASNQTKASLSRENDTYQNNTNKECVLTFNETDLIFLQQLARSKVVHVVELDLQFPSNTSNSIIKEWRWHLTNNVGREILSVLAMNDLFVTWTLNVGRKTTKVRVVDEPPGCAIIENEPGDFIAGAILKQMSFVDQKEICFDKVSNKSTQTRCCKIIGKDILKYQCYVNVGGSEFVKILQSMLSVYRIVDIVVGTVLLALWCILLRWRNTNNTVRRQGFYKLTECPMSISSILCMLFWDDYGRKKSFVRRCLLILVVFLVFWELEWFSRIFIIVLFSFWAMFYPFCRWFDFKVSEDVYIKLTRGLPKLLSCFGHDIHDVYLSSKINVLGAINLITLPFSIKRWKKSLDRFYHKFIVLSAMGSSLKDKVLSFVKMCIFCVFCLCYILFIFIIQVIVVWGCVFWYIPSVLLPLFTCNSRISCTAIVNAVCEFGCFILTLFLVSVFFIGAPYIVVPLVSGLILNVVYFFPYIVYISTVIFYCWMFWSSVEQQYAVLMGLIFDQNIKNNSNIDSSNNNDNMNNDGSNASVGAAEVNQENMEMVNIADTDYVGRDNETRENNVVDNDDHVVIEIVCVVPEKLYDKIRERLLPYHGSLFCFVLKVFLISIFSHLILTLVRILQASNISSTVQALVTFSVCAFPYIMNVVAAGKSEQGKEMWKEQLKHRVKPLVDKFTANNPEMRRTELIIRHPRLCLREENTEEEMRGEESSIETSCETIGGQAEFTANNP